MNISPTKEALSVMATLRPPSSRPVRLVYGFSTEVYTNYGYTLELEQGENPISPGSGTVSSVVKRYVKFKHDDGPLAGTPAYEITIIHGAGITSVVSGFKTVYIRAGEPIARGDVLGELYTRQVFFGVRYLNQMFSPHELGRHWQTQGEYVPGQAGNLRFAPDKLIRNFAGTIVSTIYGGIRYFVDSVLGYKPLLINVDFNGDGTKTGFGATGNASTDYWNVFAAGAFSWTTNTLCYSYYAYTYTTSCGPSKVFNVSPQTWLKDYTGEDSPVWLERIAAATAAAGSLSTWDSMLSTWIGGYALLVPEENFFAIRGLVAGTYDLYLYASANGRSPEIATTFGVAIDNGTPAWTTTGVAPQTSFVQNENYVRYSLTVPAGSVITIKAYGYFDGLQIERMS